MTKKRSAVRQPIEKKPTKKEPIKKVVKTQPLVHTRIQTAEGWKRARLFERDLLKKSASSQ
jgi:hypothetical protein